MYPYVSVLKALADHIGARATDLTPAAAVVAELGKTFATASASELREVMAGLAAVREQLDELMGSHERRPLDALREANSDAFLAGALWAASELTQARIDLLAERQAARSHVGERAALRELVLELLSAESVIAPGDVTDAARENGMGSVSPATVSKSLGDLLKDGTITQVEQGGDRRRRYFALSPA